MAGTCSRIKSVDAHSSLITSLTSAFGSFRFTADWNAMVSVIENFIWLNSLFQRPSVFDFVVFHWFHVRFQNC
jgi:hypothetical protein